MSCKKIRAVNTHIVLFLSGWRRIKRQPANQWKVAVKMARARVIVCTFSHFIVDLNIKFTCNLICIFRSVYLLSLFLTLIYSNVCIFCFTFVYVCMQIALAVLAILKLRKGVGDQMLSATPAYNDSHISVPPSTAAGYHEHDSQFSPHPFSSTTSKPPAAAAEPPAY